MEQLADGQRQQQWQDGALKGRQVQLADPRGRAEVTGDSITSKPPAVRSRLMPAQASCAVIYSDAGGGAALICRANGSPARTRFPGAPVWTRVAWIAAAI